MRPNQRRAAGLWLLIGALSAHAAPAQTPADAVVTWRGKPRSIAAMAAAADLGPDAVRAVEAWGPWAAARGYRLVLDEAARVVLVLSPTYARRAQGRKEDNTVERFVASVARTLAEFDRLVPPARLAADPPQAVVVIGVQQEHYRAVVDAIAARDERLREWAAGAGPTLVGFTLSEPLVGVWIEDPTSTEEWNPENELVHRVAAELIAQHAANLPRWLQVGLAWHIEERVMRSVYCFPYRAGFVSIYDHTDWDRPLMQKFKTRAEQPLELDEVASWDPRGGFDEQRAYLAFGIARFLADHETGGVPALLVDLHPQISEKSKVATGEFTWTTDPDYRLPLSDQLAALEKHGGAGFLTRVTDFFIQGKRYRPGAKR